MNRNVGQTFPAKVFLSDEGLSLEIVRPSIPYMLAVHGKHLFYHS